MLWRSLGAGGLALGWALHALACTPDVGSDALPEAMQFDTDTSPPRVPQPTGLVVNPTTGHIDFALAGTPLPEDCSQSTMLSPAECTFDHYLESLDGFPTLTPATAPATADLDPDTLTLGENVVVLGVGAENPTPKVAFDFDDTASQLVAQPVEPWDLGATYLFAVRGYADGVRTKRDVEVVGSPTMALLKQDASLTCGATRASAIHSDCPALVLLKQSQSDRAARENLVTLETIRREYDKAGVWKTFKAAGLPKDEIAVLWSFPIHSSPVAEIDPTRGLVPEVAAPDEIRIAVHGPVDPSTVQAFVVREQAGSVVLMDLTAAAAGDLAAGFPRIDATFADGSIRIVGSEAFQMGHQYGVFITHAVTSPDGAPLVPSPISVLLSSASPVADASGHSLVSSLSDADAAELEAGRAQLATLFDDPVFAPLTGITRDVLVYCFAFDFGGSP